MPAISRKHSVQQPIGNAIVFLQPRRAHLGGSRPHYAPQQEVEHAVAASPLTEERVEGASLPRCPARLAHDPSPKYGSSRRRLLQSQAWGRDLASPISVTHW